MNSQTSISHSKEAKSASSDPLAMEFSVFRHAREKFSSDFERRYPESTAGQNSALESRIGRIIIGVVPIVGPVSALYRARDKFARARQDESGKLLDYARVECVLACSELGLDIGSYVGLSAAGASSTTHIVDLTRTTIGLGTSFLRVATQDTHYEVDLLAPLARKILKVPGVTEFVDGLLSFDSLKLADTLFGLLSDLNCRFEYDLERRFPNQ